MLLKDSVAGEDGIAFNEVFFEYDGSVYFAVDNNVNGRELWVSDATAEGTRLVRDLVPGPGSSNPRLIGGYNGDLFFWARNGPFGDDRLWRTDGSEAGTVLMSNVLDPVLPGFNGLEHQGLFYFAAQTGGAGPGLWRTDGTTAGTELVAGLGAGGVIRLGVSLGDDIYFAGGLAFDEVELWRSDGTAAGTQLFADLNSTGDSDPADFQRFGDRIVFSASDGAARRFFGTDGVAVEQLSAGTALGSGLFSNGEALVGKVLSPAGDQELLRTDGTLAGSAVFFPDLPQVGSSFEMWRVTSGPNLYLTAFDFQLFFGELFVTDGTAAGTGLVADINPGPDGSHVRDVVRLGDTLYVSAARGSIGVELVALPLATAPDWVAEPYGQGCPGSDGSVPRIGASGSAVVGDTLSVEVSAGAPVVPVAFYFSFGFAPLPVEDCVVYLESLNFLGSAQTDGAGAASLALPLQSPGLVGLSVWIQGALVDPGASLGGILSLTPALEVLVKP